MHMDIIFNNIAYASSHDVVAELTTDTIIANIVTNVFDPIVKILFALALMMFLWGVAMFIFNASDDAKRSEGKKHIIWGLVGMTIMISVTGIISVVEGLIGI